jgi:[acyl-carrier-protein] S-malonyltransferase
LLAQLTSPVRFEESLRAMAAEGIETFVHIGPGDVTAGLVRRSIEGGETHVVSSLEEAGRVAERIGTPG